MIGPLSQSIRNNPLLQPEKTSQQLRLHEPGSLQDEEDGPKSWIVSKYVYGIKAHYKTDYQSIPYLAVVYSSVTVSAGFSSAAVWACAGADCAGRGGCG